MSPGPASPEVNAAKKSNTYFAIGGALFLLMGLLSSIDDSIVYILLGTSSYLFFLGFYALRKTIKRPTGNSYSSQSRDPRQFYQNRQPTTGTGLNLWRHVQKLKFIFSSANTPQEKNSRAVKLFLFIFFGVFAIPIIASIFSSDDTSYASSYYEIAETNYNAGQYDSAYAYYKLALKEDPGYEDALLGYGKVFSAKEQCDSAIVTYDKVLDLNPDNMYATYYKAYCYYHDKRYSEGLDLMIPLVDKNSDYYEGMLLLGDFYYAQDKNQDALAWYNKAYSEGRMRGFNLCYIMGYLYQDKNEVGKAVSLYQEALSYDSTQADTYERLGELVTDKKGDYYRMRAAQVKVQ